MYINKSKVKSQTTQLLNGQNILPDMSQKMLHELPLSTEKGAQSHQSVGRCKLKPNDMLLCTH